MSNTINYIIITFTESSFIFSRAVRIPSRHTMRTININARDTSRWITHYNRIVVTVSKHVVSCENSIRANNPIRIDKTFDLGIIIPGIEVIPSCFGIIIIPAIPDGINVADEGGRSVDVAVTIGD